MIADNKKAVAAWLCFQVNSESFHDNKQSLKQAEKHFTPDFTSQVDILRPRHGPRTYLVRHTQMHTQTDPALLPQSEPMLQLWLVGPNRPDGRAVLNRAKQASARGHQSLTVWQVTHLKYIWQKYNGHRVDVRGVELACVDSHSSHTFDGVGIDLTKSTRRATELGRQH